MSLPTNVLSGTAFDSQGNRVPLARIEFELTDERGRKSTDYLPGGANLYGKVSTTADEQGDWSTPLVPNVAPATQNTRYRVTMIHPNTGAVLNPNTPLIQMPDEDTTLSQLIPPNPISTEAVTAAAISAALAEAWATGTEPAGEGTKSSREWSEESEAFRDAAEGFAGDASTSAGQAADSATAAGDAKTDAETARDKAQEWAESEGQEPGGAGTKSAKEWADEAEGFADSISAEGVSATPAPDTIPKSAPDSNFVSEGWLNPNEFPLANQQDRERFFRNVLQPVGIDQPPDALFWPSPYREGGYEADVARPGTGWVFNNFGVLVPKGTDVLRREFDPATGAFRGALAEPQRENLHPNSAAPPTITGATSEVVNGVVGGGAPREYTSTSGNAVAISAVVGTFSGSTETFYAIFEQSSDDPAARFAIGIQDQTTSSFVTLANYIWSTDSLAVAGGTAGREILSEAGPNGGRVVLLWVRGAGTGGNSRRFLTYPFGSSAGNVEIDYKTILHFHQGEVGAFASSPIVTGTSAVIRPADTLTLPQVGDRRRGFICWEGVLDFDPGVGAGAGDQARIFPYGRAELAQSILVVGDDTLRSRRPGATVSDFTNPLATPTSFQNRLIRVAYWWDTSEEEGGISADGVSETNINDTGGIPPDDPIRFGRASINRQGRSWTNWIYISYNYPTVEQIEALTGEVAP